MSEASHLEKNFWRHPLHDQSIAPINQIFVKPNPNDLEKRILSAIDVYGLIEPSTPKHVRFLFCVVALESLLLGKSDRDYLRWKIAEKISFLIADNPIWVGICFDIPLEKKKRISKQFIDANLIE